MEELAQQLTEARGHVNKGLERTDSLQEARRKVAQALAVIGPALVDIGAVAAPMHNDIERMKGGTTHPLEELTQAENQLAQASDGSAHHELTGAYGYARLAVEALSPRSSEAERHIATIRENGTLFIDHLVAANEAFWALRSGAAALELSLAEGAANAAESGRKIDTYMQEHNLSTGS